MSFAEAAAVGLPVAESSLGHFDILALADAMPLEGKAVIADHYLLRRDNATSRIIRTLKPVPAHFHAACDEYILILSGSGVAWLGSPWRRATFRPGHLLFFAKGVTHCMPRLFSESILCFSIDTPSRSVDDVVYVDQAGDSIPECEALEGWSVAENRA